MSRKFCKEIIHVCASCKKVLQADGTFQKEQCKEAQLSHTVCEDCFNEIYVKKYDNKKL